MAARRSIRQLVAHISQVVQLGNVARHEIRTIDSHFHDQLGDTSCYLLSSWRSDTGPVGALIDTSISTAIPHIENVVKESEMQLKHIKFIIVTHIHLDHAGGTGRLMKLCPNATVLCHPRAKRHLVDPTLLLRAARGIYKEKFESEVGDVVPCDASRVQTVEDNETVKLDPERPLSFLHVKGNASHHFAIHDVITSSLFTGDSFGATYERWGSERGLRQSTFFPISEPPEFDCMESLQAIDRLSKIGGLKRLCLAHFGMCDDLSRAYQQVSRILPQLEAIRCQISIALQFGMQENNALELAKDQVSNIMYEHFLQNGLRRNPEIREDFLRAAATELHCEINAQGLQAAAMQRPVKLEQPLSLPFCIQDLQGIVRTTHSALEVCSVFAHDPNLHSLGKEVARRVMNGASFVSLDNEVQVNKVFTPQKKESQASLLQLWNRSQQALKKRKSQ